MNSGKTEQTVFFGSGPVAARSLALLLEHTTVEVVITKPAAAHHKGPVPVLELARKHNLPIFTVQNRSELDTLMTDHQFVSRYAILIDFGIIVSQNVIDVFPMGIINSHFSLLPHLRGADPITWSIVNGDKKTGVSLMLVDAGLDTGKLLTYRTLHLKGNETSPSLTTNLIALSDNLLREFIPHYLAGSIAPKNQPHPQRATYSRKLTKQDGVIDWGLPAEQIERNIRAFIEWPQSRTQLNGLDVIITGAKVVNGNGTPGAYAVNGKELIIYTGKKALSVQNLKPAGKKEMPVTAFLAGYGDKL